MILVKNEINFTIALRNESSSLLFIKYISAQSAEFCVSIIKHTKYQNYKI